MTTWLVAIVLAGACLVLITAAVLALLGDRPPPRHLLTPDAARAARARERERERNGGNLEGYAEQLAQMNAEVVAEREQAERDAAEFVERADKPYFLFTHRNLGGAP